MRIKIVSNGRTKETFVTNAETGEIIDGIQKIEIVADCTERHSPLKAKLTMDVTDMEIDLESEVWEKESPCFLHLEKVDDETFDVLENKK
jgi:hypothetical protein